MSEYEEEEFPLKKWNQEQVIVVNAIPLYLKLHIIKQLSSHEYHASLFKAFKEKYNQSYASDRLYKKSLLMSMHLKEGTKICDQLDEFDCLAIDLANLGKEVYDEDNALLLFGFYLHLQVGSFVHETDYLLR